jgi:hypothetical protein
MDSLMNQEEGIDNGEYVSEEDKDIEELLSQVRSPPSSSTVQARKELMNFDVDDN